jgi:hypothetical protein
MYSNRTPKRIAANPVAFLTLNQPQKVATLSAFPCKTCWFCRLCDLTLNPFSGSDLTQPLLQPCQHQESKPGLKIQHVHWYACKAAGVGTEAWCLQQYARSVALINAAPTSAPALHSTLYDLQAWHGPACPEIAPTVIICCFTMF